jgi:hypothetical protein
MIRIAISVEAFGAIASPLALSSVAYGPQSNEKGRAADLG